MEHSGTRIAENGEAYTYDEFLVWYEARDCADRKWRNATPVNATEHDTDYESVESASVTEKNTMSMGMTQNSTMDGGHERYVPPQFRNKMPSPGYDHSQTMPQSTIVANAIIQSAATEHSQPRLSLSRVVCLSLEDAAVLRAAESARRPPRSLHNLARHALNTITDSGEYAIILDKNLDIWFPWKEYIACNDEASKIIGPGVTHAVAEFIDGTSDANRGGQKRLDFVVYRLDGTHCRLHPGTKKVNDAKPLLSSANLATEQIPAQIMWSVAPQIPFTYEVAKHIPKIDQIGKKDAFRCLLRASLGPLPTTADAEFKWWLFVCNLGKNTCGVIGPGIVAAALEQKTNTYAQLLFVREDNTEVRLSVSPQSTRLV